ncbi:MarR family winged helix-turn-helix transcriptional regulator [Zeimonas arvi]|nr:MarR family winged helix-turn-helix transcriptional regulator [Zeimonas arvi]
MTTASTDPNLLPAAPNDGRALATIGSSAPPAAPRAEAVQALKSFRVIFRSVRQHFHEVERRCGVSGSQLWALSVVVASPGIRVKDLAQAMAVHQSTASNLVEQLSRQAFIRRERDRIDHRIVQLYPTDAGRTVIARAPRPLSGLLPDALARLEPARLAALNELLSEVLSGMRDIEPEAALTPLADI